MKEVKINKEIKEIKERIIFGLSLRQLIFSAISIVVGVAVFFLFHDYLEIEYLSWVIMITAGPFAAMGFVTFQGMPAEKIVIELLQSYVINKKVIDNKPRNTYKLMINVMDEESDEGQKKRKKKTIKQSVVIIAITLLIAGLMIIIIINQSKIQLQNYKAESISFISETYDKSHYRSDEWQEISPILKEMKKDISEQQNIDSVEKCRNDYIIKLDQIKTYAQISADMFETFYGDNTTILSHPSLKRIYEEEYETIQNTSNQKETDDAYDNAVERINEEIRSYNFYL